MPSITKSLFAGAVVLSSIQAACVAGEDDELASTEQASTGSGSGSGSGSSSSSSECDPPDTCVATCGRSCATVPVPAQGRYPARKLSGWSKTTWTYSLRATKFTVSGTFGLGHHTGVGFTGKTATAGETFQCTDTDGDGVGDRTITNPTQSSTPEGWISNNYNHGRTVLADLNAVNGVVSFTTGGKQPAAYKGAMEACIGVARTNGFCDSVCGNDAYTLPDAAKFNSDYFPQDPTPPFSNRKNYGISPYSDPARWSYAITLTLARHRVPRYGHNSNNDANAQNAMMGMCNSFRTWLDGAYDVMVSPKLNCGTDQDAIDAALKQRINYVCNSQCGGVRMSSYPNNPAGDVDIAAPDSTLNGPDGTDNAVNPGTNKCIAAGNYLEGIWGYPVCGM